MQPIQLETTELTQGQIVRPMNQLGTCGFYPKAWQTTYIARGETKEQAFLRANKNWNQGDIQCMV